MVSETQGIPQVRQTGITEAYFESPTGKKVYLVASRKVPTPQTTTARGSLNATALATHPKVVAGPNTPSNPTAVASTESGSAAFTESSIANAATDPNGASASTVIVSDVTRNSPLLVGQFNQPAEEAQASTEPAGIETEELAPTNNQLDEGIAVQGSNLGAGGHSPRTLEVADILKWFPIQDQERNN